eukprot:scaffold79260_cov28-Attheya_sp.AAC.1
MESKWQVLSGLKEAPASEVPNSTTSEGAPTVPTTGDPVVIPFTQFEPFDDQGSTIEPPEVPFEPAVPAVRIQQPSQGFLESVAQEDIALAFQFDKSMEDELKLQEEMADPIAFAASSDPDNLYMHEAILFRESSRNQREFT